MRASCRADAWGTTFVAASDRAVPKPVTVSGSSVTNTCGVVWRRDLRATIGASVLIENTSTLGPARAILSWRCLQPVVAVLGPCRTFERKSMARTVLGAEQVDKLLVAALESDDAYAMARKLGFAGTDVEFDVLTSLRARESAEVSLALARRPSGAGVGEAVAWGVANAFDEPTIRRAKAIAKLSKKVMGGMRPLCQGSCRMNRATA